MTASRVQPAADERHTRERGATLPMFALCLVVLMAMSAFATDLGLLYVERRDAQAAMGHLGLRGGLVVGVFYLLKDVGGAFEIGGAWARQANAAGCAIEQADAEMGFKLHPKLGGSRP